MQSIDTVAVVGAGRMGHGIALIYALDGRDVTLYDVDEEVLEQSTDRIKDALDVLIEGDQITPTQAATAQERIRTVQTLSDCVQDADFVTEAVAEDLDVKQSVFADLDAHTSDAILATNTSGLSIDDIAKPVADATRVLGTHWFNPPYIVPLVEVVKASETSDDVVDVVYDLLQSANKTPVVVQKDIQGFIGNRIQAAMSYEAFSLLERGVATPSAIDKAVKAGFGFRLPIMGIFEKIDQSGLDIHHEVEKQLMPDLDRGTDPNAVIAELVARGETGTNAGKGVYDWTDVDIEDVVRKRDRELLSLHEPYREALASDPPPANYDRT